MKVLSFLTVDLVSLCSVNPPVPQEKSDITGVVCEHLHRAMLHRSSVKRRTSFVQQWFEQC